MRLRVLLCVVMAASLQPQFVAGGSAADERHSAVRMIALPSQATAIQTIARTHTQPWKVFGSFLTVAAGGPMAGRGLWFVAAGESARPVCPPVRIPSGRSPPLHIS